MATHIVVPDTDELDAYTAVELSRLLDSFPPHDDVVVDLGGVTFCDSTAMAAIVAGWRRQRAGGGSLEITNVPRRLTRWFAASGIMDALTSRA